MMFAHYSRRLSTSLLSLGLAIGPAALAWAQVGPNISSGSGSGTGTGNEAGSGLGTTGTGSEAGSGLGTTGTGMESNASTGSNTGGILGPPGIRLNDVPRGEINPGGGSRSTLPTDILPPSGNITGGLHPENLPQLSPEQTRDIYQRMLDRARALDDPLERALTMERLARSATFTGKLDYAQACLAEAGEAAVPMPPGLVRDQRLMAIITTQINLAETQVREALDEGFSFSQSGDPVTSGLPVEKRLGWLDLADVEWSRAAELATRLTNENFQAQMLYKVVDSQAAGGQLVANQVSRASYSGSNLVDQAGPLNAASDRSLITAAAHARLIGYPLWRDRALVAVASNAAGATHFERGLQIARTIPQPEARADALLRIAEAQARRNHQADATSSYAEVARSIASIPQQDPRSILAGVLIDSLVAVGRFDDALSSVVLLADPNTRRIAFGAIVESQAARGRPGAARSWIDRQAPYELRGYLHRRANEGILMSVDRSRTQTLLQGSSR